MITVAAISDLHGNYDYHSVYPDVELLIIAGDLCSSDDMAEQESEVPRVISKMHEVFPGCSEIILVPGNHDYWIEKMWKSKQLIPGVKLLVDQKYEYYGSDGFFYKVYGNPRTDLSLFAFPRYYGDIQKIPVGLDILITHDCPRIYKLSCVKNSIGKYGNEEPGSKELADRVRRVKPRYHIFGHIHEKCSWDSGITKFYNVSQMYTTTPVLNVQILKITPSEIV